MLATTLPATSPRADAKRFAVRVRERSGAATQNFAIVVDLPNGKTKELDPALAYAHWGTESSAACPTVTGGELHIDETAADGSYIVFSITRWDKPLACSVMDGMAPDELSEEDRGFAIAYDAVPYHHELKRGTFLVDRTGALQMRYEEKTEQIIYFPHGRAFIDNGSFDSTRAEKKRSAAKALPALAAPVWKAVKFHVDNTHALHVLDRNQHDLALAKASTVKLVPQSAEPATDRTECGDGQCD